MFNSILTKYSRIAEDITVDLYNHTLLRNGAKHRGEDLTGSLSLLGRSKKSIIRWGDGESLILLKSDIYFQPYVPELRDRMLDIVRNYSDDSPFYLCLPSKFLTCSTARLHEIKKGTVSYYQMHKGTRYLYKRYFNKDKTYLSHFVFKGDSQSHFDSLLSLISPYKAFVVVKSDPHIVETFFNKYIEDAKYHLVTIPGKNAFQSYNKILDTIISRVKDSGFDRENVLILISAGPCAKVLSFDLSQQGFTAYDIGKFFECWTENENCRR